jgi:hypothetical protein
VLRRVNAAYDRQASAWTAHTYAERERLFESLNNDTRSMRKRVFQFDPARSRDDWVADFILSAFMPELRRGSRLETKGRVSRRLNRVAWDLAIHRARDGEYPERPQIPIDEFSGEPFRYVRKPDGGFRLYSVGENAKDDGGDADDIVITWAPSQ